MPNGPRGKPSARRGRPGRRRRSPKRAKNYGGCGMTRFLLDSGIASDYIDRRNGVYDRARAETQKGNRVGTAVPVLAELVSGIERSRSRDRNLQALRLALNALKL